MNNFFQELEQMVPGVPITMNIFAKDGTMTVSVLPSSLKDVKALTLNGTAKEFDEDFFNQIRQPMAAVGVAVANAAEFEKSVAEHSQLLVERRKSKETPAPKGGKGSVAKDNHPGAATPPSKVGETSAADDDEPEDEEPAKKKLERVPTVKKTEIEEPISLF